MKSYIEDLLLKNKNTVYDDTAQDRALIREHLAVRITQALEKSTDVIGTKNLVYFTIFNSSGYLNLLEKSLQTIAAYSDTSKFDVLFITEENLKSQIESLPIIASFTPKFLIRDTQETGIHGSIQKLMIFDYPEIEEYSKILFLDCDIVATQSINYIFDRLTDSENLSVVCNPNLTRQAFTSVGVSAFFTIDSLSDEKKALVEEKNLIPFNAGQFALMNSRRMKSHFANVRWLQRVWPGNYFFEQSFMNDYFTLNEFCSKTVLENAVKFMTAYSLDPIKTTHFSLVGNDGKPKYTVRLNEPEVKFGKDCESIDVAAFTFVHFIGAALDAKIKLDCVNKFLNVKNICQ